MAKRLLVTGAGGFVAGSVMQAALGEWEVHAVSRSDAVGRRGGVAWRRANLLDEAQCHDILHEVEPDAVIHTAAIADIDYSEAHPDEAKQVNADMVRTLAEQCADHDIRFIYLSTDNVFDGERGNYREEDSPAPINYYGRTKVWGEEAVRECGGNWVIARVAIVMGLPVWGTGNSFVSRMIAVVGEGKPLTVPNNEIRTPIDVITLGRALVEIAAASWTGVVHLSGNDTLNRYDMMLRIAKRLGFHPELIIPHDPSGIPGRAPRPRDVSLNNEKARRILCTPMLGLDEGLELVLDHRGRSA